MEFTATQRQRALRDFSARLAAGKFAKLAAATRHPAGKAGNWLATVPGKGYFVIVRLYGPTEAAIDNSWKPGEIEKVK